MWSSARTSKLALPLVVLSVSLFAACAPGQSSIGGCDVDPTAAGCGGGGVAVGSTIPGTASSSTDAGISSAPVDAGSAVIDAGSGVATVDAGSTTVIDAGSGVAAVDAGSAVIDAGSGVAAIDAGSTTVVDAGSGVAAIDAGSTTVVDAGSGVAAIDAGSTTVVDAGSGVAAIDAGSTTAVDAGSGVAAIDAGSTTAVDAGSGVAAVDAGSTTVVDAGSGVATVDAGSSSGSTGTSSSATSADPKQLPVATTSQIPQTAAYDALNVPGLAAGSAYADPVAGTKIYKLTSSTFPGPSASWNHDYAEGGDEISLPYTSDGVTRAILARDASQAYWLLDFKPGAGVSNPRKLTGNGIAPFMDLAFAFSNNPATPYYAYVSDAAAIRRIDIRTLQEAPGNGWPVTGETWGTWLHQSENDGRFVWMRGGNGSVVVIYEPSTGTKKTYTNTLINEPRMDRSGAFVGMNLNVPANSLAVWSWDTGTITWSTPGDPGIPFAHGASLRGRWMGVNWNSSYPGQFTVFTGAIANSQYGLEGPANGTLVHGSGNWIQHPEDDDDQYAMFDSYDYVRPQPTTVSWLSPGGMVLVNANGDRRLVGHEYNSTQNYTMQGFAKMSSDGKFALFTSNMDGSPRSDLFLVEMPSK